MGAVSTRRPIRMLVVTDWWEGFRWHLDQMPEEYRGFIDAAILNFRVRSPGELARAVITIYLHLQKVDVLVVRSNTLAVPLCLMKRLGLINTYLVLPEFNFRVGSTSIYQTIKEWFFSITYGRADLILTISKSMEDYLKQKLRCTRPRIQTILQAASYQAVADYPNPRYTPGSFVLSAGRTCRDFSTLLRAAGQVGEKLVVVTSRRCLRGINIPPDVEVQYDLPLNDLLALLEECKYLIIPLADSINPAGLRMLFYGLERGKAIVVSRTKPLQEYFGPDDPVVFVTPGSAEELAEVMIRLKDPRLIQELGRRGRQLVERRFTSSQYMEEFCRVVLGNLGHTGVPGARLSAPPGD